MFSVRFRLVHLMVILILKASFCVAQTRTIESLENVLKTAEDDTNKVKILDDLSWEYNAVDFKKAEGYSQQLIKLSKKINYPKGEGTGYANLGVSNYLQSKYPEAIAYYEKAFELRKSIGDQPGAGGSLNNIAMAYHQQGNYTSAINYYIRALKIFEELKEDKKAAQSTINIGALYFELKNYPLSLEYGLSALSCCKKIKNNDLISTCYNNIGNSYSHLKKDTEALNYYNEALNCEKQNANKSFTSRIYHNIGMVYIDLKDYKKAERYLNMSIPLKEEAGDQEGIASGYYALGLLYSKTGKLPLAIEYYKKTAQISSSIGSKEDLRWAYGGLKEAYASQKNYEEALKYSALYDLMKDTLYNETNSKQIAEMQTKYESEKKEKENALLISKNQINTLEIDQQKTQRNAIIIVFSLILFSGMILYNRYRLKNKNKILEEINNRNIAVFKAQEEEKSKLSKELHDGVGPLLSLIKLNASSIEVNPSSKKMIDEIKILASEGIKEVRNISHALMPSLLEKKGLKAALEEFVEQVNQANTLRIEFLYSVSSNILPDIQVNIFRIIQEAVTNTIKYAEAKGAVIQIKETKSGLELNITDNGSGFDIEKTGSGNGLDNIYSRVNFLKGTIDINSKPGEGTAFKIVISVA